MKQELHRVRITVGGDKLLCDKDAGAPTVNLLERKILLNRTISDSNKGAIFMSADIKDYFLAMLTQDSEYMRVKYKHTPKNIRL